MVAARRLQPPWLHGSRTFGLSCFSWLAAGWRPVGDPSCGHDATNGVRVGGGGTLVPLRRTREWGPEMRGKITLNAGTTAYGGVWRVTFSPLSPHHPRGSLVPARFPSGGGHFSYRNPPNRQPLTKPMTSSTTLSQIVAFPLGGARVVYPTTRRRRPWSEI
jgi:hypothetical protein